MNEAQHLSEVMIDLFEKSDNDVFAPFTIAVSGLSAAEAARVPSPGFNSVWALVRHISFWEEYALRCLQGKGWPYENEDWAPGSPEDESGWQADVARAVAVNRALAGMVGGLSEADLERPVGQHKIATWRMIQGMINHNSYHICEIISVRHMQGLWLEHEYL